MTNFDEDVLYFSMDFLPTTRVVIVFSDGKNIFNLLSRSFMMTSEGRVLGCCIPLRLSKALDPCVCCSRSLEIRPGFSPLLKMKTLIVISLDYIALHHIIIQYFFDFIRRCFWQLRKSNYSFLFVVSCFFFRNSENLGVEENQSLCTLQFATLALSNFGFRKRPPPDGVAPRLWGEGMLMQGACTAGCFSRLCPLSIEFAS